MGQLIPKPHLIQSLIHAPMPNGVRGALNEFIDNSLGDAAGNASRVEIHYKTDAIVIRDNGDGVADINAMFTLGDSHSRFHDNDIGNFGYGSKAGALFLGYKVTVDTVRNDEYRTHTVDWEEVESRDRWPDEDNGKALPSAMAPKFIRKGGTSVMIEKRHKYRTWDIATVAEKIAHTYTPALMAGREIVLYDHSRKRVREIVLRPSATSRKLENLIEFSGDVHGKSFLVRAGTKHNQTNAMNAVHIGFGHRFIRSEARLPNNPLPHDFYAEVILDKLWKKSLTATKDDISKHKAELMLAVEEGCAKLLEELGERAQEVRTEIISTKIADAIADALTAVDMESDGEFGIGKVIDIKKSQGKPVEPEPNPDPETEKANEVEGKGNHGSKEVIPKKPDTGLAIMFKNIGNKAAYRIALDNDVITITLNKEIEYIAEAHDAPLDMSPIWGVVSTALCDYVFEAPEDRASLVAGMKRMLRKVGQLEKEHKEKLFHDLLAKAPKIKEPTKTELKEASGDV